MRSLKNLGGRVVPGGFKFKEPDENKTFSTLKALLDFVEEFRTSNGIPVDREALRAEVEDWMCGVMGSSSYYCLEDGKAMAPLDHTGEKFTGNGYQGQAKWKELHEWARDTQQTPSERQDWLDAFASSLPCGECRRGWRALVRENPAPLEGDNEQLFTWSYHAHRMIREKLGQLEFTLDQATNLYGLDFAYEPGLAIQDDPVIQAKRQEFTKLQPKKFAILGDGLGYENGDSTGPREIN